ncbi:hypothetical protein [Massilia horti]|uniref:Uncharacterized protein n=1 Tax=Massilia horti TaxID=2562153 RepID=A0A4Y9T3T4_9BURK|nr:hypothetical protein [Massilia horti]TFW34672.1 hypothetical protein E4O92_03685 [Massilia horti]
MRNKLTLALLVAAAVPAFAFAAPADNQNAVNDAITSVPVVASTSAYKLRPFEFDGVQGVYGLDDGRVLKVKAKHRKLYATIGDDNAEIVPIAPNTFATRDNAMMLRFNEIPFATDVTVSMAAK